MKKAFTLAELLIALGVVGVLAAILMPIVHHIAPNQDTVMIKRAFFTTQNVVSELINDAGCYPDKTTSSGSDRAFGFEDGYGYEGCALWGGSSETSSYITTAGNGNTKFLTLFMDKLGATGSTSSFTTRDGIKWTPGSKQEFNSSGLTKPDKYLELKADVNGDNTDGECSVITMQIYVDGKIKIKEDCANDAVKVTKNLSE